MPLMTQEDLERAQKERLQTLSDMYGGVAGSSSKPTQTPKEIYEQLKQMDLLPKPIREVKREETNEPDLGPDPDIYASLIGAAPTRRENQAALADVLRRKGALGEVLSGTSNPSLRSYGNRLQDEAMGMAKEIQATRQKDIDNAQTKYYQEQQAAHEADLAEETRRHDTAEELFKGVEASTERSGQTGLGAAMKPHGLTEKDRTWFRDQNDMLKAVDGLDQRMLAYGSEAANFAGIPKTGKLQRWAQAQGISLGDAEAKIKQDWDQFKQLYAMAKQRQNFGMTLTIHEKKAMEEVTPNEGWDPKQIRLALSGIRKTLHQDINAQGTSLATSGVLPREISYAAGIIDEKGNKVPRWVPDDVLDDQGVSMTKDLQNAIEEQQKGQLPPGARKLKDGWYVEDPNTPEGYRKVRDL